MDRRFASIIFVLLAACARRYHVQGLVVQTDPAARTILVSHRPIDGYMPAMTMPFHLAPKDDLTRLTPGARVDFDLRVSKPHRSSATCASMNRSSKA